MKIRNLIGTFLGLVLSVTVLAQSNPGVDLLRLGELELAQQHFMRAMRQQPSDSQYYLGEIAWEKGNIAEAKKQYADAMTSNPESLYSQIGAAKSTLHTSGGSSKEAKKELETIYKKNKKDIPLVLEVAKAFYDNGLVEDGDKATQEARKSDKSNPLIYILEGDRLLKQGKTGDAAMQYDQAINFDSNSALALIKGGKVYETINPSIAIDQFKKAMAIDPSNKLVNRYLAKVYSMSARYPQAIEIYNEYFLNDNYNLEDIRYFSTALYFNKNYAEAKEVLEQGVKREKDNFVFNRLLMYSNNELKNYPEGLDVAEHFFHLRADTDSGYIDKDYMAYGQLLSENGKATEALVAYKKAVELNPNNVDLFKELASTMSTGKMYGEAAEFMQHYIEAAGDKVEASDYYTLGRNYQSAGQAIRDSLPESLAQRKDFLLKADASFTTLSERLPDNYLGYYMRANANSLLDPDMKQGLAKPFYEKMLEVIEANDEMEQRQSIVLTAYEYLAVYYLYRFDDSKNADDKAKALGYCDASIALNPDKASINQIKEILQQQ